MLAILTVNAQPAKRVVKAKAATSITSDKKGINLDLMKQLMPATAKIMFIDSTVVSKNDFLSHIPLNKESGRLEYSNKFFDKKTSNNNTVYINGFGNRAIFADGDSAQTGIYTADKLGDKWTTPTSINSIDKNYEMPLYPFLQSDGVTLFFAAKGKNSIGGYDIFMTRYNSDKNSFFPPENYGLPFNSTANDYLLAIDDFDQLGWLVTDRNQPEGKVCIYTFVPTKERLNFTSDNLNEKQLNRMATIHSISETWKFGDRNVALARQKAMINRNNAAAKNNGDINFVINDNTTYHSISEFSTSNRQKYSKLIQMISEQEQDAHQLDLMRDKYAISNANAKKSLYDKIIKAEKSNEQLCDEISKLEKEIRNNENIK
ncbi:hypothetical protein prwr041_23430 [Prevotella herbatica]|uniref:Uncharacterized protein n=2 Tax=Prevotella herbatica TaxID=2801997 RepID=A0ABN6EMY2_9BACT|nr:hypothetical protein prwr041_23430 [Prevotella herbatica]